MLLVARGGLPPDPEVLARELCDRHYGIGADGLIFLTTTPLGLAMEIFNSDGSLAAMCGNGIRCLAALARREGLLTSDHAVIGTRSGPRQVRISGDGPYEVEVDMGEPHVLTGPEAVLIGHSTFPCVTISMGNPHRVVFVDDVTSVVLEEWGPFLERDHCYPDGLNVEFVQVTAPDRLDVKVWERGSGATLACGTGACASLVAAAREGRAGRAASVHLPGGALQIRWGEDGHVKMRGPARELFRGEWNPDGGGPPPRPPSPPPVKLSE